jgi:hypothetical protein
MKKKEPMYKLMDIWITQKQAGKLLQYANERNMTANHWLMETIARRISDIEFGLDSEYSDDYYKNTIKMSKPNLGDNIKDKDKPDTYGGMGEIF